MDRTRFPSPSFWYGRHSRRELLGAFGALAAGALLPAHGLAAVGGIRSRLPLANAAQLGYAWVANHGLDFDAYQREFDSLASQGYRLLKLSGYSVNGQGYFASIWDLSPGPAWVSSHGIPGPDYQAQFDAWVGQGYRPVDISGYEAGGADRYAAIFVSDGLGGWSANHGVPGPDYQGVFDQNVAQGLRPVRVSGFTVGGADLFASIWVPDDGTPWAASHGLNSAEYQAAFESWTGQGYHVADVSGYEFNGEPLYTGIFEQSSQVGAWWIANHDIPDDAYQATFDENAAAGYTLTHIAGYGAGGIAHYAAVWETNANPAFAPLDTLATNAIAAANVPGVSVAIAKDGLLVFARAYGSADPAAGEAMTVDHRLRAASVAKPITATAIMQLEEQGTLSRNDLVFGDSGWLGTDYGNNAYNQFLQQITIDHLLTHTTGMWPNDGNDPMFQFPTDAVDDLITWTLDTYPPTMAPGSNQRYSNFGYCLLGRIIERATGQPYEQYVQGSVLAQCGITGMQLAGDTLADRAAGEATYDGTNSTASVTFFGDAAPTLLNNPYDIPIRRMDAHGGWIATATDLLRFVVRMDAFPNPPDVVSSATLTTMTTGTAAEPGYGRGWAINVADSNWFHDGRLPGTEAILVRRSDGFAYAAIANGNGINVDDLGRNMVNSGVDWGQGTPL